MLVGLEHTQRRRLQSQLPIVVGRNRKTIRLHLAEFDLSRIQRHAPVRRIEDQVDRLLPAERCSVKIGSQSKPVVLRMDGAGKALRLCCKVCGEEKG